MEQLVGGTIGVFMAAVVGLLIGAAAKFLMPGPDPGGWLVTILLGMAGSWVGSLLFGTLGLGGAGAIIGAILGAMLLLVVYRRFTRA